LSIPVEEFVTVISNLIPFVVGLILYRYLVKELKILLIYFLTAISVDIIGIFLALNSVNNLWLFNIFTVAEYSFFIIIFSFWQKKELKRKFQFSIPLFFLIWLIIQIIIGTFKKLNYPSMTIEGIVLATIAFYTLYNLSLDTKKLIYKDKRFWIAFGVITYFTGNLLLFSFGYLIETDFMDSAWLIHSALNITANIFYTGGYLCYHPRLNIGGS
jgi:hypothetical protein